MAKITRMQQRRGLHRDLPVPLSPGELGLSTDTRELFIGNDTSDSLGGIHNKTVQVGNVVGGYTHVESMLNNNIIEFTVKRTIISAGTGVGPFTILKVHSGLSALANHASGVKLETGINDQTLKIYKYSPALYSHTKLLPGDPDGTPIIQGGYNISGTNQLNLVEAKQANDIIYIVYLNKKDLETYVINAFNSDFNRAGGSLTDLTLKLSTDQLYFDESTGEGFIGLNNAQITDTSYSGASSKTVKTWLQEWITDATNKLNAAIDAVGSVGPGEMYTQESITGEFGIARFGDDSTSTVPTYTFDGDLGFTSRSHVGAVNMTKFLNQAWLREGSLPTRELAHVRSNIKVLTETNVGDVFSNLAVGNPMSRQLDPTTNPGGANIIKGTQTMRPLGSSSLTNQGNLGTVRYETSSTRSVTIDYVIEWYDATPTYHVIRTGSATISMPELADSSNVYGHGLVLDQWNEMDIKNATGALSFAVGADFDLGVIVAKRVTLYGDPVIENDFATLSSGDFQTKYGTAGNTMGTHVFWADNDSTSATYQKNFGFITYSNTRPVAGHIRFINKRF